MKKLVLLLLMVITVLGLSACSFDVVYEIDKDGNCTISQTPWLSVEDFKMMVEMAGGVDSLDAKMKMQVEMMKLVETPEQLRSVLQMSGATEEEIIEKEVDGVVYFGFPAYATVEKLDPADIPEGNYVNADTFKIDLSDSLGSLDEQLTTSAATAGKEISDEDLATVEMLKNMIWYDFTVKMPKEIVFTNGELSEDKKSVKWHFSMASKDMLFYAYTADSDQIISLGLEDGAFTKKKSVKVTTPDKIQSVTVNGKAVNGSKISLANDGEYAVTVKTKGYEKTVSFTKDSTKPVVTGVENGKTYTGSVTIKFSDELSGIKSAKLGKKKIKNGKTITKAGTYTLKVTDKAGNKTTVKFKIK